MKIVNRSALLVRPKDPYVHWANSFDDAETILSLDEHREGCTVYLVQEVMDERGLGRILKRHYENIFEYELAAWMADESTWPSRRDYKTFVEWFDVECHSVVCDISNEELLTETLVV